MRFRWETEFKETEIGEIPKDWEVERLDHKYIVNCGQRIIPNEIGQYPVFGANGFIGFCDTFLIDGPAIITGRVGTLGKVFYIEGEIYLSDNAFAIQKFKNEAELKFLYYFIDYTFRSVEDILNIGTSQPLIKKSDLNKIQIPHPPLSEQTRIAAVLSYFDDLIENKKRQNKVLENTAMAIFKSWFIDFEPFRNGEFVYNEELGKEIPKGWEVKAIGEIAVIESGGNAPQSEEYFTNGIYPFVRVKHMSTEVCVKDCDYINEKAIKKYNLKIFNEGSLIIQKSGESLKESRVNIIPFKACIVNHLAIFDALLNKNILFFLYCSLREMLKELIEGESGTTLPYLRISDIQNKFLPLPPSHILQSFHSLVEPLFEKIILNQKQIMLLRKIRDRLLPLLVFGKLRIEEI
ncbi:MAG: restriction endonuclease subunit S [Dictyoglomaceae bacterium]|nr:restriction endonuclease subunit S [Dictyoglomaceae bacterium]